MLSLRRARLDGGTLIRASPDESMRSSPADMKIDFFVAGIPKAQPRVKAFVRGGHAGVYTPDSAESWKQAVRQEAVANAPESLMTGPIRVELDFFMPRPKAHLDKHGVPKAKSPVWHCKKPDLDNLIKAVTDAITDTQKVWLDDSQIYQITAVKTYALYASGCSVSINAE
ncbi:MAG: RusA family crossover junction endodeoxyribonuclease [Planctomycetes bacterium]|nr:RusA family crossover junction endodeoxyribonuclease [Planctomycetota bacterium]